MKQFDYVHFVGIGGISMSGIAKVLLHNGVKGSGSDTGDSKIIDELKEMGADIFKGHSAENITTQSLVVYTAAVKDDNPELVEARKKGIKTIDRATMLGHIMKDYSEAISIAGTHGKTTTTAMMAYVLIKALKDPTVMVGGELDILDGNFRLGKSPYFVTESCEYCRSFLKFFPKIAVVLNVEEDHLDYYKDIDDIKDAFRSFANLAPSDGAVIVPADSKNALDCVNEAKGKVYTFGIDEGNFYASNISFNQFGYPSFDAYYNGKKLISLTLSVLGKHNVKNSMAVIAVSYALGLPMEKVKEGLEAFSGTKRRFEKKGFAKGALVIDDYAHHPTEILTTIDSVTKIDHKKTWFVFQPHTYTRTYTLFDDFVSVLSKTESLIIADIYAAREKDTGMVSSKALSQKIPNSIYMDSFSKIENYLWDNIGEGDIVITVGAGNVVEIGEHLVEKGNK